MWATENRGRYDRSKQRYPSDLTDEAWSLVEPLVPAAKRGGNKRTVDVRQCREQAGREASPTVATINSQSVKSTEKGGSRTHMVTMPGRRSRARSATSWSIPRAC